MTIPLSLEAPAWQLRQIAAWHEAMAEKNGWQRHMELARRLRDRALVVERGTANASPRT
jgi:hypothetical protein